MITDELMVFPNNAVSLTAIRAKMIDPDDLHVVRRPLRETDPNQSIGVFGVQWQPNEDSVEMRGTQPGPVEPTIQRYLITVQSFVKDMDEERGLARHSVLSKLIRSMLYRDDPLGVGLRALTVTMSGSTESARRWGIGTQRFISNELSGEWLFMSTLDYWLETENT